MPKQLSDPADPISLAHEPRFTLYGVEVDPATRQLGKGARRETVEPRIMQVLVALARAEGAVVTGDELIARCWDGRIVGENAIHRTISRIRQLAATIGEGAFQVETIARVGYRIVPGVEPAGAERTPRWWLWAALGAGAVALLGAMALLLAEAPERPLAVAILGGDPGAETLARGLAVDLEGSVGDLTLLGEEGIARAPRPDYSVRVGEAAEGAVRRTDLALSAGPEAQLLWSASIERPARETAPRRGVIAARLAPVLRCLAQGRTIDAAALRIYLAWCGSGAERFNEGGLATLRRLTAAAPDFAPGWANLALCEAIVLYPESNPEDRRAATTHLRRARALDSALPDSFIAEAELLTDPARWGERLRLYERAMAAAPDDAPAYVHHAYELTRVGRMQDSVRSARRAVALDPFSSDAHEALVSGLAYSGQSPAAFRALDAAERIWPGARDMRALRYRLELRYGDPRRALAFHDQPDLFDMRNPPTDPVWEAFLRARIDPRPATIDAAIAPFVERYRRDRHGISGLTQALGQFGRADEAYRLLADPRAAEDMRSASEVLFRSHMRPLRDDPRFIALSARIGLLHYWRESGIWPDFCLDPHLPYDCRAEADRLGADARGPGVVASPRSR